MTPIRALTQLHLLTREKKIPPFGRTVGPLATSVILMTFISSTQHHLYTCGGIKVSFATGGRRLSRLSISRHQRAVSL